MSALSVARQHSAARLRLIRPVVAEGRRLWRQVDANDLRSWDLHLARLATVLAGAQLAAAQAADTYVDDVLATQGHAPDPSGRLVAAALAGVASDGRTLDGLLGTPTTAVTEALRRGVPVSRALAGGEAALTMILSTQVADAGRVADGIAIAARPGTGWVRMLNPPACSRCAVLAGKFFRYNKGFDRHPRCNCTHIPATEAGSGDLRVDPREYFDSLREAEQDKLFTKKGARAIRDGADIGQVVNARRGMGTAGRNELGERVGRLAETRVFGQDVFTTLEGTTRRGLAGQRLIAEGARLTGESAETVRRRSRAGDVERTVTRQRVQVPRLMPEEIYRQAKDRDDALRLLRRFGFII